MLSMGCRLALESTGHGPLDWAVLCWLWALGSGPTYVVYALLAGTVVDGAWAAWLGWLGLLGCCTKLQILGCLLLVACCFVEG